MSDCGCSIGGDGFDAEPFQFQDIRHVKAKKPHQCCECGDTIQPGQKYQYWVGKFDGEMGYEKTCLVCAEIRAAFSCDAWPMFGEMWAEMIENMFPQINTACYEKLSSPAAKAKVQKRWMEWKGLAA